MNTSTAKKDLLKESFGINWQTATVKDIEKIDVNDRDQYGRMPLHYAANWSGDVKIVKALISQGADVNAKDKSGATPLHDAAYKGNYGVVEALIKKGADVNATDNNGNTPLHMAVMV